MKKLLIVSMIILSVLLAACSGGNSQTPKQTGNEYVKGFNEKDLIFALDGVEYPLNSDAAPLLNALGTDYKETKATSCAYIGEDKMFEYEYLKILTYPKDGKDLIDEIYFNGGSFGTSKGVKIGSTLEEVKANYGGNGFEKDGAYVYVLSGNIDDLKSPQLIFELTDGKVSGISFYAASNVAN
ncbi:MAG: hypothetical protein ACYCX2_03080 [Christensenellales bacterium]